MTYRQIINNLKQFKQTDVKIIAQSQAKFKDNPMNYISYYAKQHYKSMYYISKCDELLKCKNMKDLEGAIGRYIKNRTNIIMLGHLFQRSSNDIEDLTAKWAYECDCRLIAELKYYLNN